MKLTALTELLRPFGGGTAVVIEGAAADLLEAIRARFLASPAGTAVTGGIFLQLAGRGAVMPYVVCEESGASLKLKTSSLTIHDTRIRFRIYDPQDDGSGAAGCTLGDQVEDAFTDCTLSFVNGWTTPWVRGDRKHLIDRNLSRDGAEVWYLSIEFTTRVKR